MGGIFSRLIKGEAKGSPRKIVQKNEKVREVTSGNGVNWRVSALKNHLFFL